MCDSGVIPSRFDFLSTLALDVLDFCALVYHSVSVLRLRAFANGTVVRALKART